MSSPIDIILTVYICKEPHYGEGTWIEVQQGETDQERFCEHCREKGRNQKLMERYIYEPRV